MPGGGGGGGGIPGMPGGGGGNPGAPIMGRGGTGAPDAPGKGGMLGLAGVLAPAAASMALAFKSLSLPASMMPLKMPVRNVDMGTSISKNFWSIGEMALSGCVTNMIE